MYNYFRHGEIDTGENEAKFWIENLISNNKEGWKKKA